MNLLFDLDGTLTDNFPGITKCIAYALDKMDKMGKIGRMGVPAPSPESLYWCIGPPLKNSFLKLLSTGDDYLAERALGFYRERYGSVGLYENEVCSGIPEALEVLQEKGHALFVATSKPTVFAERIVVHFKLERYFTAIYGSELDGTRCDKTSLISHILKRESIPASEAMMIGDRKHDMIGAKNNGLYGVGVLWGYGTKEELETSGAHAIIGRPHDLIYLFD
jgi:phosphoglycolate phosphatase